MEMLTLAIVNDGDSLAVQGLGLLATNVGGVDLIPGQGTKIPHAVQHGRGGGGGYKKN